MQSVLSSENINEDAETEVEKWQNTVSPCSALKKKKVSLADMKKMSKHFLQLQWLITKVISSYVNNILLEKEL